MSYTPNDDSIFTAAFSGAMAGITGQSNAQPSQSSVLSLSPVTIAAGAYAQAFDTTWSLGDATELDLELINSMSETAFAGRILPRSVAASYITLCEAIIRSIQASRNYYTDQAITPPPQPGGAGFSDVVNIMDYYDDADGGATINGHTTKNIAPAMQRAYEAKIQTNERIILFIPPCVDYDVEAWSWLEGVTWLIGGAEDNIIYIEIVGSGSAGKIYPDPANINDKLSVLAGGPDGMPTQFVYRNMFWCGSGAEDSIDCLSLLKTTTDMEVLIEGCIFFSLLSSSTEAMLDLSAMALTCRRNYFFWCGNTNETAVIAIYGIIFGAKFQHTHFYGWERDVGPFGTSEEIINKMFVLGQFCNGIWLRGDSEENASRVIIEQCEFSQDGLEHAILADPSADEFFIESIEIIQCHFTAGTDGVIRAVSNVRDITIRECRISHNFAVAPSISLAASSCNRLTLINNIMANSGIRVRANTGQESVIVEDNTGGDVDFSGCGNVVIDASSTFDAYADAGIPAPAARVPETAIVVSDTSDVELDATQYMYDLLHIVGEPGGAFNVIGPDAPRTRFTVLNKSLGDCTIKIDGGTGVVIAATKSAQVYHDGNDYVRLTPDA